MIALLHLDQVAGHTDVDGKMTTTTLARKPMWLSSKALGRRGLSAGGGNAGSYGIDDHAGAIRTCSLAGFNSQCYQENPEILRQNP